MDEFWLLVDDKGNEQWVWLAIDAATREIVGVHIGDHSAKSAQGLWQSLPPVYRSLCCNRSMISGQRTQLSPNYDRCNGLDMTFIRCEPNSLFNILRLLLDKNFSKCSNSPVELIAYSPGCNYRYEQHFYTHFTDQVVKLLKHYVKLNCLKEKNYVY